MELLKQLRQNLEFNQIMDKLWEERPVVPVYIPQDTMDKQNLLMERIKFDLGRQDGFDQLYRRLTGRKKPETSNE